ncbi:MAG TPA: hypothetical protein VGJ67_00310 [Actinomycetota bacterium]|jgi:hypothetical protein
MTTPLVLLGLAILAGAVVWVLSVRHNPQRGSSSWERPTETTSRAPAPAMASTAAGMAPQPVDLVEEDDPGDDPQDDQESDALSPAADSFAYVPLGISDGLNARTRLMGIAGLIALIVLTGAAVALGMWLLGHALGGLLSHFANG